MKKVLDHSDKENYNCHNLPRGAHPSQETQAKPFKPTIKYISIYYRVGYKLIESQE
jgi:hypothetical protein